MTELSWTTYILTAVGIGYFIPSCRDEIIAYYEEENKKNIELLEGLIKKEEK